MRKYIGALAVLIVAVLTVGGAPADAAPVTASPSVKAHRDVIPKVAPPCTYEDGYGMGECVWDARHRGNGNGRSFVAFTHTNKQGKSRVHIRYVTHKRAHRIIARWDRTNHAQCLLEGWSHCTTR